MLAFQEGTQKCETKAFILAMPTEPVMSPVRNSPKETIRFLHNDIDIFQDKEKHPGVFQQQMRKNHNQKTELCLVEKQTHTHYLRRDAGHH